MTMTPNIRYVARSVLDPYLGYANPMLNTVWVRNDLPQRVMRFVLAHELYHLRDKEMNVLLREIKANWAGFKAYPLGALWCVWLTITDAERWRLYWRRYKEGK